MVMRLQRGAATSLTYTAAMAHAGREDLDDDPERRAPVLEEKQARHARSRNHHPAQSGSLAPPTWRIASAFTVTPSVCSSRPTYWLNRSSESDRLIVSS